MPHWSLRAQRALLSITLTVSPWLTASASQDWSFHLRSIDPYEAPEKSQTKEEKEQSDSMATPKIDLPKAPAQPPSNNTQHSFKSNQKSNKPLVDDAPFTFAHKQKNKTSIKGYSIKETRFNWGGKENGKQYLDYEFIYDAMNEEHTKVVMDTIMEMSKNGWAVDLNRSFQEVNDSGKQVKAIIRSEMRFRKDN